MEDEEELLDEGRARAQWPDCGGVRRVGEGLFLVEGIASSALPADSRATPEDLPIRAQAERWLAEARRSGDRKAEASALTDLGILLTREAQAGHAVTILNEALEIAQELGDRSREGDVLSNLGAALVAAGDPGQGLAFQVRAAALAREAGDRLAEGRALERLGLARAALRDASGALRELGHALDLSGASDDRVHEADLRWALAIQLAELGSPVQAMAEAGRAVEILRDLGRPQAGWYADHLRRYRAGEARAFPGREMAPADPAAPATRGPDLLRMAVTATEAMAKFVGSGLRMAAPKEVQERLAACASCDYHTGLRCQVCGCFTKAKARLKYEDCPINKWSTHRKTSK